MVTEINLKDRWGWFNIETDDWCLHNYKLVRKDKVMSRKWSYKERKIVNEVEEVESTYYEWETETGFAFRYTQFPIVLNEYVKLGVISVNQCLEALKEFEVPNLPEIPRSLGEMTMRDDQMEVLNKLMTKRFGLCHVCTGFGKTEMIAFMCYFYTKVMNWNVLVTSPNAKVLDEIVNRVNSRLGIQIGVNYPNDSGVLAINAASVSKQKYNHHNYSDYLSTIKVVLADEAEACLSPTHHQIYDYCKNRECMYGFSATPDCYCGKLDVHNGVTEASFRSKHLLNTFGGSLVNIVPEGFDIDIIDVNVDWWESKSEELRKLKDKFDQEKDPSILPVNFRTMVDNDIFMQPEFAKLLGKLSEKYTNLLVTINRTEIIDYWVDQLPEYKIIEVSGRGYRLRYQGEIKNISIDDLKSMYTEVSLILGSKSLMRGVDLPELVNSVQLSGKSAGTTIQSVGRTARKKRMRILFINPDRPIFGYMSQNAERKKLIRMQYPSELNSIKYLEDNSYRFNIN